MAHPYTSHDDWISLIDPAETRDFPSDKLVEVKGALCINGVEQIVKTYYSSKMGDWMYNGDPTHWREIKQTTTLGTLHNT